MTGIVLALTAIFFPTRVDIPREYLALFAAAPLVMLPFIVGGDLTPVHGAVLLLLFVVFIAYVASRELRRSTPVFRNAEILERIEVGGSEEGGVAVIEDVIETPADRPPFVVTMPFNRGRQLHGWGAMGLAVVALIGLIAGATITSSGTEGILEDYEIQGALFGATIATLVLTLEDILLTVEPTRKGASEIGVGNVIGSVVFGVTGKLGIILLAGGASSSTTTCSLAFPDARRHHRPRSVLSVHRPAEAMARVCVVGALRRLLGHQLHRVRGSARRGGLTARTLGR